MKNNLHDLNLKLPKIKRNNKITKSVKDDFKNLLKKMDEKNIIKFERNTDITNHLKNLSRNNKKIISKKQNDLTINLNEKKFFNKLIFNNNNNPIKILNPLNLNKNNSNNKNTTLENIDGDIKTPNINAPNTISTTKNSYYISFYSKNVFFNNNKISNFSLYKNNNIENNSTSNRSNNKTYISYNNDKSKINNYTQNNIKLLKNKKSNKKIFESQIQTNVKNINDLNDLKYQLIMPKITQSSNNLKKYKKKKKNEENKVSKINKISMNSDKYFISQPVVLKEIRNIENLNHINNFIAILKQSIFIEIELNDFLTNNQTVQNNINKLKKLIDLYNTFFNQLDYITLDINIFLNKEYNSLLQKIIKLSIYYHCFVFILLILNDEKAFLINMKLKYYNILKKISFCLYNIFGKYIYKELSINKYKDLSFVNSLNNLFNNNIDYIIKSAISNNDIFIIISKNYNSCLDLFIKTLNSDENEYLNEVIISLKNLLLNINQRDLIYHIDICLNIFLYSILEKNISKSKINSEKNKSNKNKALSVVPYLPPISQKYKYTIVLDIDETLGHFIHNEINLKSFHNYGFIIENDKISFNTKNKEKKRVGIFLVRPYAKYFLEKIKNLFFEIVIFSAGTKDYCDKVLDILDLNNNLINYRLYRTHLSLRNINNDVKDLSLLGRDLSKLIMIDNFSENYKLQQDNGLPIDSWIGDVNDTSLRDIIPIMNYIVDNNIEDVRTVVKKVKIQLNNFSENNYFYDKVNLKF